MKNKQTFAAMLTVLPMLTMAERLEVNETGVVSEAIFSPGTNKVQEIINERAIAWGRRIALNEISLTTGKGRMTIAQIVKNKGSSMVGSHLDMLCQFVEHELHKPIKTVPDNQSVHIS